MSPYTYSVAAITIASGTNNLGIYMPLFATRNLKQLLVIVVIFLMLVGVWCYGTRKLVKQQAIAQLFTQRGHQFLSFILIGLATFIVLESRALHRLALAISGFCLAGLVKKSVSVADLQAQPISSTEPLAIKSTQS